MHTHHARTQSHDSVRLLSNARRSERARERERNGNIIQLKIHWQLASLVCALCTLRKWRRLCVRYAAKDGTIWQFESIRTKTYESSYRALTVIASVKNCRCHRCCCRRRRRRWRRSPSPYVPLQHGSHRMHLSYGLRRYRRAKCLQFELNGWTHAKIIINRLSHF